MSQPLPQSRLLARLLSLDAVKELVQQNIFPELVPTLPQYPAVVYQVISNEPYNDADGGSNSFLMKLQVSCLAVAAGPVGPYTRVWQIASAVCGDPENEAGPTGVSGWRDPQGSIWHLVDEFDEAGEIRAGTETYWAYVVNQLYTVQYLRN
jgi:hypothetical protein